MRFQAQCILFLIALTAYVQSAAVNKKSAKGNHAVGAKNQTHNQARGKDAGAIRSGGKMAVKASAKVATDQNSYVGKKVRNQKKPLKAPGDNLKKPNKKGETKMTKQNVKILRENQASKSAKNVAAKITPQSKTSVEVTRETETTVDFGQLTEDSEREPQENSNAESTSTERIEQDESHPPKTAPDFRRPLDLFKLLAGRGMPDSAIGRYNHGVVMG